ncbi:Ig-like domain-containing protein [Mycolicibacterium sp. YH-1]|uniref:Ig-like domain-containing protein n=1 Tax=Mycolicibacterium sp. YH-1 TaxID=2908837 RepID=UPI001F4C0F03|nr:Ig-like domain-containing protein [Mycolicibacterium sp. YH-1]UNB53123.1 Ig-like domain-containing protein [Mycolicibacterium sp. YH-1]
MAGAHTNRRSRDFGVRRWLQVGAASAGVSAALFALSLTGPQVGVALADDSGQSSSSGSDNSSPGESSSSSSSNTSTKSPSNSKVDSGPKTSVGASSPARSKDDSDTDTDTDDTVKVKDKDPVKVTHKDADKDPVKDTVEAEADAESDVDTGVADPVIVEADVTPSSDQPPVVPSDSNKSSTVSPAVSTVSKIATVDSKVTDSLVAAATPEVEQTTVVEPDPLSTVAVVEPVIPWALQVEAHQDPRREFISRSIIAWTSDSMGWIGSLPVPTELKWHMEGAVWAVRRTFLNLAPAVAPVQVTGQSTGPITGRVDAVDPEGDRIVYRVVKGPTLGTVELNGDGTFTYTPGADFNGVDSFVIVAQDQGLHVNLFDPFRGGTRAGTLVNQGAIKFAFNYTTGAEYWTQERRDALQASATAVAAYLMVNAPVLLTYDVTGEDDSSSTTLAAASSELVSTSPGFFGTVVQNKLIHGIDSNGAEADGEIDWNFDSDWALGDVVGDDEYDFKAVAMHELMHSFGFTSRVRQVNTRVHWPVFSSFIVTAGGHKPIGADFKWDTAYDDYLTGANGGFYFGGANAVAAYGGLVPLFTPNPYESGSSMAHLDDKTFTGADEKMMNAKTGTGLSVRVLSPIELAILKDIGYIVVVPQQASSSPPANMLV